MWWSIAVVNKLYRKKFILCRFNSQAIFRIRFSCWMFIGFGFKFMQSVRSCLWRYGTILGLPYASLSPCHMAFISKRCTSCATSGTGFSAIFLSPLSLWLLFSLKLPFIYLLFKLPISVYTTTALPLSTFCFFSARADGFNVKSWLMRHDNLTQRTVQALLHLVSI